MIPKKLLNSIVKEQIDMNESFEQLKRVFFEKQENFRKNLDIFVRSKQRFKRFSEGVTEQEVQDAISFLEEKTGRKHEFEYDLITVFSEYFNAYFEERKEK